MLLYCILVNHVVTMIISTCDQIWYAFYDFVIIDQPSFFSFP